MTLRSEKISKQLQRVVAESLVEHLQAEERLTVTRFVVTPDLRQARAWLHGWNQLTEGRQGYLQRELGRSVAKASQTKFTPRLIILDDDSGDYVTRIHRLLEGDTD